MARLVAGLLVVLIAAKIAHSACLYCCRLGYEEQDLLSGYVNKASIDTTGQWAMQHGFTYERVDGHALPIRTPSGRLASAEYVSFREISLLVLIKRQYIYYYYDSDGCLIDIRVAEHSPL